ncbi:hypothetical protein GCM10027570_33980 [Streptomonospora sediminis]
MPTTVNNSLRKTRAAVEHTLRASKGGARHLRMLDLLHALKAYEGALGGDPAAIPARQEALRAATAAALADAPGRPIRIPAAATVRELDEALAAALWAGLVHEPGRTPAR